MPAQTVVLIHGLWMTGRSWEQWVDRYEARGLRVLAPSWPGMNVPIEQLREDTSTIDKLGIEEIVDHYEGILREQPEPPIVMGHSFGGVFTQLLLDRGLGAAGVAIDPGPVQGLLKLAPSTLRSGWPILKNPANRHRAVALTPEEFHYAFTNTMSDEESLAVYERYAVPGPGGVLYQAALANFHPHAATHVERKSDSRAPLLLIGGGEDHIAPASQTRANARLYRHADAVTDYKEFPGRSHYIVGQAGWEEVADYALEWALAHTNAAVAH